MCLVHYSSDIFPFDFTLWALGVLLSNRFSPKTLNLGKSSSATSRGWPSKFSDLAAAVVAVVIIVTIFGFCYCASLTPILGLLSVIEEVRDGIPVLFDALIYFSANSDVSADICTILALADGK